MKKLLVVVDYQKDFVTGSLGFEKAELLEDKIAEKIILYRDNGYDVVFTLDTHFDDYLNSQEGKNLPVKHCIKNTEGWNLYGKISDLKNDSLVFEKNTFGSDKLFNYLQKTSYDIIELAGLVCNICVLSNAVLAKTARPEAQIIVDKMCTTSIDDEINDAAIKVMRGLQITVL